MAPFVGPSKALIRRPWWNSPASYSVKVTTIIPCGWRKHDDFWRRTRRGPREVSAAEIIEGGTLYRRDVAHVLRAPGRETAPGEAVDLGEIGAVKARDWERPTPYTLL